LIGVDRKSHFKAARTGSCPVRKSVFKQNLENCHTVVEGDTIVGWAKNSAFSVQKVLLDGKLAPLDLTPAKLALQADSADMEASKAGVVGISSLIAGRRIQEHNTGNLPSMLREAAFECATTQILDRIQGHSVVGVRLYDC
jgi:hypothetical protein